MKIAFKNQQRDFYFAWNQINILCCKWAEQLGVNSTMLMTLYGLDIHGNMTQKNICDFYGFPKQTVNRIVHNLIKERYVVLEKSKNDKREKLAILTETGKAHTKQLLTPLYRAE